MKLIFWFLCKLFCAVTSTILWTSPKTQEVWLIVLWQSLTMRKFFSWHQSGLELWVENASILVICSIDGLYWSELYNFSYSLIQAHLSFQCHTLPSFQFISLNILISTLISLITNLKILSLLNWSKIIGFSTISY